jgi:glycyl-tRNA synthetase alpha subunit
MLNYLARLICIGTQYTKLGKVSSSDIWPVKINIDTALITFARFMQSKQPKIDINFSQKQRSSDNRLH